MIKAFVIAMQDEADCILSQSNVKSELIEESPFKCYRLFIGGKTNVGYLIVSGIGKVNAAMATTYLLTKYSDIEQVVNFGLCGSLDSKYRIGETYYVNNVVQYDFSLEDLDGSKKPVYELDLRMKRKSEGLGYTAVTCCTMDRFTNEITSVADMKNCGGHVREMELAAVAQVSATYGKPLFAFKTVSNYAGRSASSEYCENKGYVLAKLREAVEWFLPLM